MRAFTEYHLTNLIINPKITAMVTINPFLKSLLEKESLSMDAVLDLISQIADSTEDVIRIMSYLCGHECPKPLPRYKSADSVSEDYQLVSYNIFTNRVYYKGVRLITRYFKTEEEANEANLKEYNIYDCHSGQIRKSSDYPIAARIKILVREDSMTLDKWNKMASE